MVPTRSLMNLHHVARMRHEPHAAAAALRSSRSRTIGYLIDRGAEPEFMSDVDLFRNRVWRGITDMAEAQAYFFLQAGYVDAKRCRALLSSGRVDGLVVDDDGELDCQGNHDNEAIPGALTGRQQGFFLLPCGSWLRSPTPGMSSLSAAALRARSWRTTPSPAATGPRSSSRRNWSAGNAPTGRACPAKPPWDQSKVTKTLAPRPVASR